MRINFKITPERLEAMEYYKKTPYTDIPTQDNFYKVFFVSAYSIFYAEIKRNLNVWIQNIFAPFINAVLYFLVFGILLGSRIGEIQGFSYIQYLIPGFMVMPIITASFGNGSFTIFHRSYFKSITQIQMSPAQSQAIMLGYTLSGIARSLTIGFLIWLASIPFSDSITLYNLPLLLLVLVIVTSIFTLVGMINGSLAKSFEELNFVATFILQPLLYVSGVFYPLDGLPKVFLYLSYINPLTHIVSLFRYAFLGIDPTFNIWASVLTLAAILAVLYVFTLNLIRRKFNLS